MHGISGGQDPSSLAGDRQSAAGEAAQGDLASPSQHLRLPIVSSEEAESVPLSRRSLDARDQHRDSALPADLATAELQHSTANPQDILHEASDLRTIPVQDGTTATQAPPQLEASPSINGGIARPAHGADPRHDMNLNYAALLPADLMQAAGASAELDADRLKHEIAEAASAALLSAAESLEEHAAEGLNLDESSVSHSERNGPGPKLHSLSSAEGASQEKGGSTPDLSTLQLEHGVPPSRVLEADSVADLSAQELERSDRSEIHQLVLEGPRPLEKGSASAIGDMLRDVEGKDWDTQQQSM